MAVCIAVDVWNSNYEFDVDINNKNTVVSWNIMGMQPVDLTHRYPFSIGWLINGAVTFIQQSIGT